MSYMQRVPNFWAVNTNCANITRMASSSHIEYSVAQNLHLERVYLLAICMHVHLFDSFALTIQGTL